MNEFRDMCRRLLHGFEVACNQSTPGGPCTERSGHQGWHVDPRGGWWMPPAAKPKPRPPRRPRPPRY